MQRILIDSEPFIERARFEAGWAWVNWGNWPAWWVDHPGRPLSEPSVAAFRLKFTLAADTLLRLHVSADNRYRIFLDGQEFGRGPERGDAQHWFFESYEGLVPGGEHLLAVQTWWLGDKAPYAQMSVRPGFLLATEEALLETLSTGLAKWETALMPGIAFISPGDTRETGWNTRIEGNSYPWDWETGGAKLDWHEPLKITPAVSATWKNEIPPYWMMLPATLPPMLHEPLQTGVVRYLSDAEAPYPVDPRHHLSAEAGAWQHFITGKAPVQIPARARRTVLIDLENYYCAYPELIASGGNGARITLQWGEGLFSQATGGDKGQRDGIDGRFFRAGVGDDFQPDGGVNRRYTTLWWQAGRYLEITVTTGDTPLTLDSLALRGTRYPLEMEGSFQSSDERFSRFLPIAERAMQMCSHETYVDCPYYEQLMYIGDTRLEALTTYTMTPDDRLPRKALLMFDWSRRNSGFTQSRYPSRVCQIIPPFSLWWVCMVHDYWTWRDDPVFVKERMPGIRTVMEAFRACLSPSGLMAAPNGWNFTDWVKDPLTWPAGVPPGAEFAPSAVLNCHFAFTLLLKSELESYFGEPRLAARDRATAKSLTQAVIRTFWNEEKGLIADDAAQAHFSEHTQCLALLGGLLDHHRHNRIGDALCSTGGLAQATIYFTHYLFETYRLLGRDDLLFKRLELWHQLPERGFKTTFESPEPSRSDCHAWGAHPLFHCYATILGIRPVGQGFSHVHISPLPGPLEQLSGTLPHPRGSIDIRLRKGLDGSLSATVCLPPRTTGRFSWKGKERELSPGTNDLAFK